MALLGIISSLLIYMDTQDYTIYHVWIHTYSYLLCLRREEKTFGLSWNQTQVLLFTSECSNH